MLIYLFTNTVNGKRYIGQTISSMCRRKAQHIYNARNGSNLPIHAAIRKYGIEAFKIEVLFTCSNKNSLNQYEKGHIKFFKSQVPNGYNRTEGGDGVSGGRWTISPSSKRMIKAADKAAVKKAKPKYQATEEHRASLSASLKGKPKPWQVGRQLSAETREKMSKSASKPCSARAAGIKAWWDAKKVAANE